MKKEVKLYAEALQIRYTYSCNGDDIWFIDMGIKDSVKANLDTSVWLTETSVRRKKKMQVL